MNIMLSHKTFVKHRHFRERLFINVKISETEQNYFDVHKYINTHYSNEAIGISPSYTSVSTIENIHFNIHLFTSF